jgi:transglutaminase-like putative cysteine protease
LAERIWVLAAVALFSGWHWQQLERPMPSPGELALLAVLAAVPAVIAGLGRRRLAIMAAVPATLTAIWRAFGYLPWDRGHEVYPLRIVSGVHDGARSWFETSTPFDPSRFATTSGLLDLCFFGLMAVFAWLLIDGRFALAGLACAFALYAIPSTAVGMGSAGLRAAIFLLLALAILAVCQRRVPLGGSAIGQLSVLAVATVVAGLVIGSAPGVAKGALFDWRHWNPLAGDGAQVSVGYVWNQDYGPLHWPKQTTTVFQVQSARPHYWKAGVLTVFDGNHWVAPDSAPSYGNYHQADAIGMPVSSETSNELHPDTGSDITQVGFTIEALADPRVLSTGQPLRYTFASPIDAQLFTDGSVEASSDLPRGASYTVRAYSPNPKPKQLSEVGNAFPASVAQSVVVNHAAIPVWGGTTKKRVPVPIDSRLVAASNQAWHASGADEPGTSEYGAVVALESYFHGKPFTYDQTPPVGPGPVLAHFMLHSHRGYCQMYSGSMALVLRLHGIPARVAYGFTEGAQTQTGYKVTDRDAHAWVEAFFPKYGWIPFEPTPTRNLPEVQASTTNASWVKSIGDQKNATQFGIQSHQLRRRLVGAAGPHVPNPGHGHGSSGGGAPGVVAARPGGHSFFVWAISAAAILIAVLAVVKLVAVRWRYLRRGPRGQASAAYHELATYIGDQGVRVNANATFEELAGLVEHTWGVDASALAKAGSAARYAPPQIAARAGHDVRPALRRIRRDLRKSIDLRDRAMGSLRLRSMLAQTTHLD